MALAALEVIRCPSELRSEALRWLHAALPKEQQEVFGGAVEQAEPREPAVWDGLLVIPAVEARSSLSHPGAIAGAVWVHPLVGNTAYLWSPPGNRRVEEALFRSAAEFADKRGIPLTQLVVGPEDGYSAELLTRCGFPKFAELSYLFADVAAAGKFRESPASQGQPSARDVRFVSLGSCNEQRFGRLIEQTYIESCDCPGLDDVRSMAEVLAGYRAQGRFSPDDWYIVERNDEEVGALILAEHPAVQNWELVYMGLIPAVRRRGIGQQMVRFALEVVAARGGERLVVAVDSSNEPALLTYQRAGLIEWDRRIVYARLHARS
jgi:ribosomal protein S18 acetylase RimI-like enzyme